MLTKVRARILLAEKRDRAETTGYRSLKTSCDDIGMTVLDETLAGGCSISYIGNKNECLLLLPLAGAVCIKTPYAEEEVIIAGQTLLFSPTPDEQIVVSNPYNDQLINYLMVRVPANAGPFAPQPRSFHLDSKLKKLTQAPLTLSLGKFNGREEAIVKIGNDKNTVVAFVIQGAFEVQNRLLESRDTLMLCEINEVAMEALSGEAIIMLISLKFI